jgi:hypothetical protein
VQSLSGRSSSSSSTTTTHAQDFCFPVLLERACRITARQVSCRGQPAAQQLCKGFLAQQIPAAAAALWVAAFFRVVADAVVGVIISLDRLRIEPSHTGNGGLGSSCGGGVQPPGLSLRVLFHLHLDPAVGAQCEDLRCIGEPNGYLNGAPCPPLTTHDASIRQPFGAGMCFLRIHTRDQTPHRTHTRST